MDQKIYSITRESKLGKVYNSSTTLNLRAAKEQANRYLDFEGDGKVTVSITTIADWIDPKED